MYLVSEARFKADIFFPHDSIQIKSIEITAIEGCRLPD